MMDIRSALLAEHSKRQTMAIVDHIGADPKRFAELMTIFLGNSQVEAQRAAWAVRYCAENHHELAAPYIRQMTEQLERTDGHPAVRRNVAVLLQFVDIPKRMEGRIFDACYRLVDDPRQPVAVRVFAMTVAVRLANGEPALLGELRLMVQKHVEQASIAFSKRFDALLGGKRTKRAI